MGTVYHGRIKNTVEVIEGICETHNEPGYTGGNQAGSPDTRIGGDGDNKGTQRECLFRQRKQGSEEPMVSNV